jgi:hypothetical protein
MMSNTLTGGGRDKSKIWRIVGAVLGGIVLLTIGAAIGGAGKTTASPHPAPTVTITVYGTPLPGPTVTETVTPTANANGEATQIDADGVYVIGKDIPGGTWHTSGGAQCYEATLSSTNTGDIIDNNNITGPDTVSLAGAKAFEISGGCTWRRE